MRHTLALLSLGFILNLAACSTSPPAPVIDRLPANAGKSEPSNIKKQSVMVRPLYKAGDWRPDTYTVKKGDNLMKIALQFNQNWRDIVDWNSLVNPNDIKVGQALRVAPLDGAQLSAVPTDRMEIKSLDTRPAPAIPSVKSLPLGNKLAYSDQVWADIQRGDAAPARSLEAPRKPAENTAAAAKFSWPTEGKIISTFDPTRKGIDIAGQLGQPITSAGDGTVLYAKNMRGYGNLVILDHNDGLVTAYAHNKTILVKEGQTVTRGQKIAEMGNSDTDAVKLHFEVRQMGKPVDPVGMLPGR